jgi:hypothetical protein
MSIDAFSVLLGICIGLFAVVCVRLADSLVAILKGKTHDQT